MIFLSFFDRGPTVIVFAVVDVLVFVVVLLIVQSTDTSVANWDGESEIVDPDLCFFVSVVVFDVVVDINDDDGDIGDDVVIDESAVPTVASIVCVAAMSV